MGIESRVFNKELLSKITTAEEAAKHIKDGMIIGTSGFTPCGYPKAVPLAVAERIKKGEKMRFSLLTGASVGVELDEAWAEVNASIEVVADNLAADALRVSREWLYPREGAQSAGGPPPGA